MHGSITNARIVTPEGIVSGAIVFEGSKIARITQKKEKIPNSFDAQGKYVLPGLIETHGHFREPGLTHKEDIEHGTKAAIAGGFTTVFDMPNTKPPTTTVKRLKEQVSRYRDRSYCDFAINFGSSVEDIAELNKVDPKDITGVKVFTAGHQTTPTTIPNIVNQARIWEIAAKRNIPVLVHAEQQELVTSREQIFQQGGFNDLRSYSKARNELVVETAAWQAVALAKHYRTKLWLLHASTEGEFDAILYLKDHGVEAGAEVTGYQLFFATNDYDKYGTKIKVCPALRNPQLNVKLWLLMRQGIIDGLCSEHTPHLLSEKEGNVWEAASGAPGIQELAAVFLTGWARQFGKKTLEEGIIRLAQCACTHIAHFFGYPQKSGIVVGNDADIVIIDINHPWRVAKEDLFTKCGWSPYEGMELVGRPTATFLRGELVYEQGNIIGKHRGQWLVKEDSA